MVRMRRFVPLLTVGAVLAAAFAAQAGRVDAVLPLGKSATIAVTQPGDVATAAFLVQSGAGKKLLVTAKLAAKSKLAISDVRLVAPDGTVYDATALTAIGGKSKVTTKSASLSLTNVPAGKGGLWRVEVRGTATTAGGVTVTVKGSDAAALVPSSSGDSVAPDGSISKTIDVGSNQALSVTITRAVKQSAIKPQLKILDPLGNPLADGAFLGTVNTKTGMLTLKSLRLPVFGRYTLVVSGQEGAGGAVKVAAKTAPAKAVRGAPVAVTPFARGTEPTLATTLDGTSSHGAAGSLTFLWTQVSGAAVALGGPETPAPTFAAPAASGALGFEMAVAENGVWSAPVAVAVDVAEGPLADAGRSLSVAGAADVTLDARGSFDRGGLGLAYRWRQDPDDATQVTLAGATTATPSFRAPANAGVLHFGVVVDDGTLESSEDWVTVRVGDAVSTTPDAGRGQIVPRMATVHLSALATLTASGPLDAPLQWTKVSGPAVTLENPTSPWPSFTAPKTNADFLFEVTAGGASDVVHVHVRGAESNLPPLTRANGAQTAASGSLPLDASASTDPESNALSFRWAQVDGAALAPADRTAGATTVALPAGNESRTYAVQARDVLAYGPPDFVAVRNTGYTGDPVAVAGADLVVPSTVTMVLDGRNSFRTQGSGPLTYRWRQVSAKDWYDVAASSGTFDAASAYTTFTIPSGLSSRTPRRTLTFELIVNDGENDSAPDLTTITLTGIPTNGRPVVEVTSNPASPLMTQTVTLSAQVTDPDDDPVTLTWSQTRGTNVVLSGTGATRTFTAPVGGGDLDFRCSADDGFANGVGTGTVTVHVDAPPVAAFSMTPSSGPPGTAVGVDATPSSDTEGQTLTYTWSLLQGSASVPLPPNSTTRVWSFQAPNSTVGIRLVVNDGRQNSAPKDVQFVVGAPISVSAAATPQHTPSATPVLAYYGEQVTLTATPTGQGTITYQWRQLTAADGAQYANDPQVASIENSASASATITAPKPATTGFGTSPQATFQVLASNGSNSATSTVLVTFRASFDYANSNLAKGDTVYGIVEQNCFGSTCHSGTGGPTAKCSTAQGFGMGTAAVFRQNTIGITACYNSAKTRIVASNSAASAFIDRLKHINGSPSQMPTGGALSAGTIALIQDWIDQGALNN